MLAWCALFCNMFDRGTCVPTVRQIDAFHAVMTTGGVTKAAASLGLGQPAVSRLIADLENAVGFQLFQRAARTLIPTPKARELSREVERSFLGMEHIRSTARRLAASNLGALRLAIVPSLVSHVMHDLVGPFAKANPDIALAVEVLATIEAVELLESANCDIGITNEQVQTNGLQAEPISTTVAVAVVPQQHPFATLGRPVRPRDLAGERFISFMPNAAFRRQIDRMFAEAGVARDLCYEARTTAAACEMASALDAVTIVPVAPRFDLAPSLRVLPFHPTLSSTVVLLKQRQRALPPTAELFAAFARQRRRHLKQMAAGRWTAGSSKRSPGNAQTVPATGRSGSKREAVR
jgi:DNA-binding transcriptional LysR family regulator